jgi:3-methyl-2-oxobutanoate hydroxymethyltransferase
MPFMSYQGSVEEGLRNAGRFLKEAGAHAVKIEGPALELTARLTAAGIPVMAHLGLTPQSVHQFGGFKVQGRAAEAAERILADAVALADAGAFSVVLEGVPRELGRRVTEAIEVPTIGIGAGPDTDGQVLVVDDLLGRTGGHLPRFVKQYADLRGAVADAAKAFSAEVASGDYPGPEHAY